MEPANCDYMPEWKQRKWNEAGAVSCLLQCRLARRNTRWQPLPAANTAVIAEANAGSKPAAGYLTTL